MRTIQQIPFAVLGAGAAFTVLWGVVDPMAAFAEVKTYTGVGKCTMGDLVTPEQAQNYAREKAMLNAREQAGVYLANYTRASNTRLAANEITAITNNITEIVGAVNYTKQPGEVHGEPVIVYTATLTAKVDTDGIQKWLRQSDSEKASIISQSERIDQEAREALEKIEALNRDYGKASSEQERERIRREFDEEDGKLTLVQMNREALARNYRGDYAGAIQILRQVTELDPNAATPWMNLGGVYLNSGDRMQAIRCEEKAISLDPDNYRSYVILWAAYADQKDWANVVKYGKLAMEHGEKNIGSVGNLIGYAYNQLDQPEKAVPYLRRAIEHDSRHRAAYANLGESYLLMQKSSQAVEILEKGVKACPENLNYWEHLALAYYCNDDDANLIRVSKKAIALGSESSIIWRNLANAYRNGEDYDKAFEAARKAISLDGSDAEAWENLADIYDDLEDYPHAIEAYEKAVSLEPNRNASWRCMGRAYAHSGNPDKGIECLLKAVEIDPNDRTAWNNLGATSNMRGDYESAIGYCKKAIALEPDFPNAYNHLGNAYFHLGRYAEAEAELEHALELKPDYAAARETLAQVRQAKG